MQTAKEKLNNFPLFADLNDDEIGMIADMASWQRCRSGMKLFNEGDDNGTLYGIVEGALAINKRAQFDVEQTLCRMGAGDFMGEVGFINGGKHCASAEAVEDSTVFRIGRKDFDAMAARDPELGYKVTLKLAGQLGRFLKDMDEQYLNLSSYVWGRGKR